MNLFEFRASLVYKTSSKTARPGLFPRETLSQKPNQTNETIKKRGKKGGGEEGGRGQERGGGGGSNEKSGLEWELGTYLQETELRFLCGFQVPGPLLQE